MRVKRFKGFNFCVYSLCFLFIFSCARVNTIGLVEKKFSKRPENIIWLQVAGLSLEQLAILRFSYSNILEKTSFESSHCISKMWSYNLFKLRPSAYEGFLSQITGSRNIKNSCKDYERKPLWSYLNKDGFKTLVFETGVSDKESLTRAYQCGDEAKAFREDISLFRMSSTSNPNAKKFHYQDNQNLSSNGIYYDKSCQRGVCYASGLSNMIFLWEKYSKIHPRTLFIIRDFKIKDALMRDDIASLRVALAELEKVYAYFSTASHTLDSTLLLLTTAGGRSIELPKSGKAWGDFEKKGKNILFKRSSLLSTGLSYGASSENFCGFYDESEVLKRILWSPKKQRPIFL